MIFPKSNFILLKVTSHFSTQCLGKCKFSSKLKNLIFILFRASLEPCGPSGKFIFIKLSKNEFLFKFHIPKFTNGLWNLKTEILVFMKTLLSSLVLPELWSCGVVVITTAQLHLTKPEIRFCAGSNPAHGMSETCEGEDL